MAEARSFSKLKSLPLGSVTASGWLREQLIRNKDGMGGHLDELEPRMIATPYTTKETEPTWGEERKAGWGAEISGNYWTGLIELAFTLDDDELKAKAKKWVNEVLSYQRADGYLGSYTETDNFFDDYNAWGNNCGLAALLAYYDATGQENVLSAVYRCLIWFCENWTGDKKSRYAGISITESMMKCYLYTGDQRLLIFCEDYYKYLGKNDLFGLSLEAMNSDMLHYNTNHGAGYANHISQPAEVYDGNGDPKYLNASINAYKKAKVKVIQKTGGITCESEYIAPLGSIVESEYCSFTMLNKSLSVLNRITGSPEYADDMERVVFNGAEGARKKDERAIAYLSSPNQVFATADSSYADHRHQVYAPCVPVACCPVTSVRILPEFISGSVLTDDAGSLYFSAYAPVIISFEDLRITVNTLYPFGDTITFTVTSDLPVSKAFNFKIPGWCDSASISVNGSLWQTDCKPSTYAKISRLWESGDTVTLILPMKVRISQVDDTDRSRSYPLAVEYGPILFALPIPERWDEWAGNPVTPLPDGWHWYNVNPNNRESDLDVYDNMGMRKYLITYNVALDEALTPDMIGVIITGQNGYIWENPLIKLKVPAYKAPYLYPPYPAKTLDPHCENGRAFVAEKVELELVPFGCTALRISYFPRADLNFSPASVNTL